jgi:hypothetical protein
LLVRTITLTQADQDMLDRLSRDASDFIGRTVSGSAIVRALIRQVVRHGPSAADALFMLVEKELKSGVRWGKKK